MQASLLSISSYTFYILLACAALSLVVLVSELLARVSIKVKCVKSEDRASKKHLKRAPGPRPLPIIGNLAVLDGYEVPYQAFSDLAEKYGPIVSLQLGKVPTVVVNGIENIREVLINKTAHFDSRPNFRRYHQLFSGNKENSLAFCDWSDVHKQRRDMLIPHTFPRNFSERFQQLDSIITNELSGMLSTIDNAERTDQVLIKQMVLKHCCNVFSQYFCSRRFDNNDPKFDQFISNFDKIFYEVNQGYAADFLPFLMPLHTKNLKQMENWSHEIRSILLERIIADRFEETTEEQDYVDCLINHVKNTSPIMDWNTALFALEDIVGGHSAVGNFITKVLAYIVQHQEVQAALQKEIDAVLETSGASMISLDDRKAMPYTEAVIMEALRMIASPIVPHVSNQQSTIGGYDVEPNTLIFLNNYDLSMSPKLWTEPESFKPERFLQNGRLTKPEYFLPFGGGRRSCLGYKMVQLISFSTIANMLKDFNMLPIDGQDYRIRAGTLAASEDPFRIRFVHRNAEKPQQ